MIAERKGRAMQWDKVEGERVDLEGRDRKRQRGKRQSLITLCFFFSPSNQLGHRPRPPNSQTAGVFVVSAVCVGGECVSCVCVLIAKPRQSGTVCIQQSAQTDLSVQYFTCFNVLFIIVRKRNVEGIKQKLKKNRTSAKHK